MICKCIPNIPKMEKKIPKSSKGASTLPPNLQKHSLESALKPFKWLWRLDISYIEPVCPSPGVRLWGRSRRNTTLWQGFFPAQVNFGINQHPPPPAQVRRNRPNIAPASAPNAQKMALQAASMALQAASKLTHQVYEHSNQNIQILEQIIARNNIT